MTQEIYCIKISDENDPLIDQIEKTYTLSFPENERRDFNLIRGLVKNDPMFNMYSLFKANDYAGFITIWQFTDFVYIEHFAIEESARNGGIGAIAMQQILDLYPVPVVLEVEMPTDDISERRIGFYERLGFKLNNHPYQQPPYRKGEDWFDMRLMIYGNIDIEADFQKIKDLLYKYVYGIENA